MKREAFVEILTVMNTSLLINLTSIILKDPILLICSLIIWIITFFLVILIIGAECKK